MARLPGGGCIDRYEASLARGALGGLDGRDTTGVAASVEGRVPIAQVTLAQARRLCENAVKRLCSEKEWQSACRPVGVTQHFSYPYGSRFEAGRCNDWTASASGTRGPAPAGSFVRCVTAEGVYDLSGNLVEWAWPAEERDGFVAVHGGSFNHTQSDASCDEDDYKVPVAGGTHADIGFRCCL